MSQLAVIFFTSALTIFGGLFVLALGEIIKGFFIEPIHELSLVRGKIIYLLTFYANMISNPGFDSSERLKETASELRHRASQLDARSSAIPYYGLWQRFGFVPKLTDVEQATRLLIRLSNSVHRSDSGERGDADSEEVLRLIGFRKVKARTRKSSLPNPH